MLFHFILLALMQRLNYLFIFGIFLFSCLTIHQARKNAISYFAEDYSNKVFLSYQFAQQSIGNISDIFYRDFEEPISHAFYLYENAKGEEKQRIREQLLDSYMAFFENHKDMGLTHLHFHLSDGSSFIRFHKPDTYGDHLFAVRESVRIANQNKRFVSGFEEGKIVHGFRYIYPLFYDASHLGSMGFTFDFSAIKREMVRYSGSTDIILIVRKDVVRKSIFQQEYANYKQFCMHDDFMVQADSRELTSDHSLMHEFLKNDIREIDDKIGDYKPFSSIIRQNGGHVVIHFMPLQNIKGTNVGYIIAASDNIKAPGLHYTFYFKILFGAFLLISFMLYWNNRIKNLNVQLASRTEELKKLSITDNLTGQYNRLQSKRILEREFRRAQRYQKSFACLLLDIDRFKSVNDTYGHHRGDAVLVRFCSLIRDNIRAIDSLGRWGGEEFIVVCPETDVKGGLVIAENIRGLVAKYNFTEVGTVTTSIGVACYDGADATFADIVQRADEALYEAKDAGRNTVRPKII